MIKEGNKVLKSVFSLDLREKILLMILSTF